MVLTLDNLDVDQLAPYNTVALLVHPAAASNGPTSNYTILLGIDSIA